MRLPTPLVAVALALVLCADGAAVLLHDDATPYSSAQALEQFRADLAATPSPSATVAAASAPSRPAPTAAVASDRPAAAAPEAARASRGGAPASGPTPSPAPEEATPGVYTYATSGHEEADVLGGSRHDYPTQSTITYTRGGCGTQDRWQPLKQRLSVNTLCPGPLGLEARDSVQRREFFGQSEEQVLSCTPGLVLVPYRPRPGSSSTGTCRSDDTRVALTARVLDVSPMTVGGRTVTAIHVEVVGTLTGSTRGSTHREEWFTSTGLLLRGTGSTDTDRDTSAGTVHYTETYDVRLTSLDPER